MATKSTSKGSKKLTIKMVHCFDHLCVDHDDPNSKLAFEHLSGDQSSVRWHNREWIFTLAKLHGWDYEVRPVRKNELDDGGG